MRERKKLLVSVSGGETSVFMAQWLWNNRQDEFEMVFVFSNTGEEDIKTLYFMKRAGEYFGFPCIWVEAVVHHGERKSNDFRIVDYKTCSKKGEPFEEIIKKHGIPNQNTPHCTRELKQVPIRKYAESIGWKDYYLAIGIRYDEADRINAKAKELKIIYPLISRDMKPMTKPMVNHWWSRQTFRLGLKGWEGNCKTCWKKSFKKLYRIANDNPEKFDFMKRMEEKYENFTPESRLIRMKSKGIEPNYPVRFFRGNKSTSDILFEAQHKEQQIKDDAMIFDLVGGEQCEIFSECGS
jgi:hypothetical protein